jgi:uncharacterized protein YjaZ
MQIMQTYKCKTQISNDGVICLPNKELFGKQVEIIIKPLKNQSDKQQLIENFIEKWSGILADVDFDTIDDSDDSRFQYLKEKYLCNK